MPDVTFGSTPTRSNSTAEPTLAVVGGGPRALQALVEFEDALTEAGVETPVEVQVWEPATVGAGSVWSPFQASHLVMNVDPSVVDFSSRTGRVPHDYRTWERVHGIDAVPYPPRSRMGEYLTWVYEQLLASPVLSLTHVATQVAEVGRTVGGWSLVGADGSRVEVSEVLLCTGHAGGVGPDHAALVADLDQVAAGSTIAVRGAGLTGLDVLLSLTEGRGGGWVPSEAPSGLRWLGSGQEPTRIELLSRSGELMMPKPERPNADVAAAVASVVRRWKPQSVPDESWWTVLIDAAVAAAAVRGGVFDRSAALAVLDEGRGRGDWQELLQVDLARTRGHYVGEDVRGEAAWWLGRAWANGYPAMVASLERGPRPEAEWSLWRSRAARLERWAFGPPAVTARRLLALGEAGVVTVRESASDEATHVVDAVTVGPGVRKDPYGPAHDDLWGGLLGEGHAHTRVGERGVATAPDGVCLRNDGRRSEGLAALGRPTEDLVIGHDTLMRTLHRDFERWAAGLTDRITAERGEGAGLDAMRVVHA